MRCIVVMPTYNERENITRILAAVLANGSEWEALVVDDNSPDGTGDAVAEAARMEPRIHLLRRPAKMGLGTAYRDGLSRAAALGADYVCTMDSDFSHDPAVLPRLRALAETHGAAHGSRYTAGGRVDENWGLFRRLNSGAANALTRLLLGVSLRDCTSGFRCYRRDVMTAMAPHTLTAPGYAVLEEMLFRCARMGVSPAEHPIVFADRRFGKSKINWRESVRGLTLLFRLRVSRWRPSGTPSPTGANPP